MTGTAGAGETQRLDELAAVTREYGAYASARGGLGGVVLGAWLVATFVIALRSQTWGRIAALWSPAVALTSLAAGKRYYQRFGRVEGASPVQRRAGRSTWLVALFMVAVTLDGLVKIDLWASPAQPLARWAVIFALATAPVVPLAFDRLVSGIGDGAMLALSTSAPFFVAGIGGDGTRVGWILALVMLGMLAVTGTVAIGAGLWEHRLYRRLERRLAALRSSAP